MAAYLFSCNPKRRTWVDHADGIYRVNNNEPYDVYWSCGNRRNIDIGDRFLLTTHYDRRLSQAPRRHHDGEAYGQRRHRG
jgi:hypothetical protein